MRKTHFAISELLEMGLEILPNTVQGLYYKAKKENWLFRETPCQGGKGGVKREYALPPAVLDAIWQRRAAAAVAEGAVAFGDGSLGERLDRPVVACGYPKNVHGGHRLEMRIGAVPLHVGAFMRGKRRPVRRHAGKRLAGVGAML